MSGRLLALSLLLCACDPTPLDPLGVVTDHDRALLAPYLEGL